MLCIVSASDCICDSQNISFFHSFHLLSHFAFGSLLSFQLQQFFLTRWPQTWMNDKKSENRPGKLLLFQIAEVTAWRATYLSASNNTAHMRLYLQDTEEQCSVQVMSPMRTIMKINSNIQEIHLTKAGERLLMYGEAIGDRHE